MQMSEDKKVCVIYFLGLSAILSPLFIYWFVIVTANLCFTIQFLIMASVSVFYGFVINSVLPDRKWNNQ